MTPHRPALGPQHPHWPQAVQIAKRISAPQRAALLLFPGDGQPRLFLPIQCSTMTVLERLRLVARWCCTRSVEDARAYGRDAFISSQAHTPHDAYSLTMEYPQPYASVQGRASGQLVVMAMTATEKPA